MNSLSILTKLLLISIFVCACGLEIDSDDPKTEIDQRSKLLQTHKAIAGRYLGTVKPSDATLDSYDVELNVYSIEVMESLDSEGRTQFRPSLKVRMKRSDFIEEEDFKTYDARFYQADSSFVFSDSANVTFNGHIGDEKVEGLLTTKFGVVGQITAKRVSVTAAATLSGAEAERRKRFYEVYDKILGSYQGEIVPFDAKGTIYKVKLSIFIVEEAEGITDEGEPRLVPRLRARLAYVDYATSGIDRTLSLRYFVQTSSIAMLARSPGVVTSIEPVEFSISGRVEGDTITATVVDQRKPFGTLSVVRYSKGFN